MPKDTSISIRMDSELKEQSEQILSQLGLNMTSVVNMLFHQIVRERAVPLSLSLNSRVGAELRLARLERQEGFVGRSADEVAADMERIIAEVKNGR
jgi:DNA-damage-inducible protein J